MFSLSLKILCMSILLSLSADFIDKMSNPAYGSMINEEYALKLGQLMKDELFVKTFETEVQR